MTLLVALFAAYALIGAVFAVAGYRQHADTVSALHRVMVRSRGRWWAALTIASGACAAMLTWPNVAARLLHHRVNR